jgi:hypothetical protein
MKKNMKHPQHSVCFQERPLVIAVRHALPYLVGLSLALAMAQNASSRSSDSAAAFTATQLVRQFTLKNTVSQVSMGMQGYISEINGEQRGPAMGARPAGFPSDMGSVPATVNLPRRDGAGRPLGYCAWDNAAAVTSADYNAGQGVSNPLVYAIVSPGLNGNMQTTCANVLAAGVGVGDDHVQVVAPMQVSSVQYKSSVATFSDLPPGAEGDIRLVRDTNKLYSYVGGAWAPVQAGPFEADAAGGVGAIAYTTGKVTVADFQAATATITGATTIAGALSGSSATFTGAVTANTFTGNGAGLVDLNADNFSTGVVSPQFGGTGVNGAAAANGTLLIGNGSGFTLGTLTAGAGISVLNDAGAITIGNNGVISITGTVDQVITSANNGDIVLSLPQSIATTSMPTFAGMMLNGGLTGTNATFTGAVTMASLAAQRIDVSTSAGGVTNPNMIVGTGAMPGAQSGFGGNTALGISALNANIGHFNTATGINALRSNTNGGYNTASGSQALEFNTGGYDNSAFGTQALWNNTTGIKNTAVGVSTGNTNTTGSNNTFIGANADATTNGLNYATAIGSYSTVATSNTIALGRNSAVDQVVIGTDTRNNTYANTKLYVNGVTNLNGDLRGTTATFTGAVNALSFAGDGSGLNNLNASNFTLGIVPVSRGGTGLDASAAPNGSLLIGNGTGYTLGTLTAGTGIGIANGAGTITLSNTGVTSLAGTANQVNVSAATGAITLSLPQNIATTSTPTFGGMTLNGGLTGTTATFSGAVTANSFSGNGSALTNLNASNITTGTLPVARGGTGLSTAATNGQLLIGNGTGYTLGTLTAGTGVGITNGAGSITLSNTGVTSLAGTANQVNVSASTGAITLSLPQSIGLGSDVQFGTLKAGSNTPIVGQGAHLQWNRSGTGGSGRTFLVNQKGLGGGGISFGEATTGDVYTQNMLLDATGNLTVVGSVTANSFSGNGSALTNLNASNITTGTLPVARGGTGLSTAATNGQLLIGNGTGYTLGTLTAGTGVGITNGAGSITLSNTGVTSLAGTANQVNVSAATGAVTLSLPQSIGLGSDVQFGTLKAGSNTPIVSQGAHLQWNRQAGLGRTYLINQKGNGGGGISFGEATTADVYTQNMFLDSVGNLSVVGSVTANSFSGNGSGLTNLNASNFTTGTVHVARGGTGLDGSAAANGSLLIGNGTGYTLGNLTAGTGVGIATGAGTITISNTGVTSLAGTANQVNVSAATGAITLSLPQAIATTSAPTFGGMTLNGGLTGTTGTFSGEVAASSLQARGNQAIGVQGSYLQWNRSAGVGGRTFLVNQKGLGGGGISFGEATTADVYTENMALSSTGNLTVVGSVTANSFSGNGSALTNLNASNITTGTLPVARGGTGLSTVATNGQLLIGNGTGYTLGTLTAGTGIGIANGAGSITLSNTGVTSLAGTANQVNVSAATGAITLSLPQAIATTSAPTFGGMTLNGGLTGTTGTFSGEVAASSLQARGNQAIGVQGSYLQWNRSAGVGGRTFLVNQKGLGGGGISFGEATTADVYTENMALSSTGNLTVVGSVTANSFSGNGSGLTNLNASNFTTGTVPVARGGTGLDGSAAANGSLLIGNGTGYTLGTLTGTANQVNVSNGAGAITLSLPQPIAITSTPTFGGMTLNGGLTGTTGTFSGDVQVATGRELRFGTYSENSDGLFITRLNPAGDQSILRISAFDNFDDFGGAFVDEFQIGRSVLDRSSFTPLFRMAGSGNAILTGSMTANSFAGDGSALTNLNASNFTTGTVPVARGGTGLSTVASNGQLLIGNGTGYTLGTLTGTANQVNVTNGAGTITLSLPQAIATTSTPTFGGMTLNGGLTGTTGTFSGEVAASSLQARGNQAIGVQGAYLQWNRSGTGGSGRTFLVNQKGLGTGGISFGEVTTGDVYTQNMLLDTTGNLTVVGSVTANSFSGNGSGLTDLNASNFTTGTVPVARGGTGLSTVASNGQLLIGNGTGYTLGTLTGTANQVNVSNGAGAITLSLPQPIATTSAPTFGGMTLNGGLTGTTGTFSGEVAASSLQARGNQAIGVQGAYLQWNRSGAGGSGRTFLVNQKGSGTGGISFGEATTADVYTENMFLGPTGNLSVVGAANFGGNTTVGGTFGVAGTATFGGLINANAGMQLSGGQPFRFGAFNENTDDITMTRISSALDVSLLRISIGDNSSSFENDQFEIGSTAGGGFNARFRVAPGTGDVIANGYMQATSFNVSSDRRLKKNITAQNNASVLDRLEQLQTYSYEYINNPAVGRRIGVIAQEVQTLFPEAAIISAENGMMSVDYNALGAMAAMGVGQLNSKFKVLDGKVNLQGEKLLELDGRVALQDTRIGSLEGWKTEAVTRMDGMQGAIDLNIQKIAENAVAIQTNSKAIERLDDALFTLDGTVKGNTESITNINARWARNFTAAEDGSSITVNAVELKVSNFTAQQVRANAVYSQRLEAEIARIADLEVNNLRANSAVANTVQAEQVNTGSVQVYAGVGMPAVLFAAKADGHYTVSTSSLDGSYATATVIVNAGQAKVVSGASEGIELVAEGNMVKAIAAGKSIKASWIKMG